MAEGEEKKKKKKKQHNGYSIFDLKSMCDAPGARGLTFKLGFGSRDLKPDKL